MPGVNKIYHVSDVEGLYMVDTEVSPLALRIAPGTEYQVVDWMPTCSEFEAYGFVDSTGMWYYGEWRCDGKNPVGWCSSQYLTRLKE